jgi:DNA-binding NtrC family response regulator
MSMRQRPQQNAGDAKTLHAARKVLIFDEDIEDLARHAEPFEAHGCEVHKCMSVETAMRCIEREEFDFALVDQGSPAFEGLRVIRHLLRYSLHTPFVVIARCKDGMCHQQALALGATGYLEKPVPSTEMNWIIKNHFGRAH